MMIPGQIPATVMQSATCWSPSEFGTLAMAATSVVSLVSSVLFFLWTRRQRMSGPILIWARIEYYMMPRDEAGFSMQLYLSNPSDVPIYLHSAVLKGEHFGSATSLPKGTVRSHLKELLDSETIPPRASTIVQHYARSPTSWNYRRLGLISTHRTLPASGNPEDDHVRVRVELRFFSGTVNRLRKRTFRGVEARRTATRPSPESGLV